MTWLRQHRLTIATYWVAFFGMWPLADPGHNPANLLAVADLMLHGIAAAIIARRAWLRFTRLRETGD